MLSSLIQKLIKGYHVVISPWLGTCCRFAPTCSEYTHQAIQAHGVIKGGLLGVKRLCKCHPLFSYSGYDPIPQAEKHPNQLTNQKKT